MIYNQNGAAVNRNLNPVLGGDWIGWSGAINYSHVACDANPVTVTLETDGSVAQSGVNVTFTPL